MTSKVTVQHKTKIDKVKSPSNKSFIWPYLFILLNYLYRISRGKNDRKNKQKNIRASKKNRKKK